MGMLANSVTLTKHDIFQNANIQKKGFIYVVFFNKLIYIYIYIHDSYTHLFDSNKIEFIPQKSRQTNLAADHIFMKIQSKKAKKELRKKKHIQNRASSSNLNRIKARGHIELVASASIILAAKRLIPFATSYVR